MTGVILSSSSLSAILFFLVLFACMADLPNSMANGAPHQIRMKSSESVCIVISTSSRN